MDRMSPFLVSFRYGVLRCACNPGLVITLALAVFCASDARAEVKIAAFGDSLTQGYGLAPDEGFVPQLQAWLEANGTEALVLNFGVSGDTTAGGLARIGWTLSDDVDALVVALGGNDLLRGIDPGLSRANLDGILAMASQSSVPVLLVGMEAPSNYGADFKQAFDSMYSDLAKAYGVLLYPNFLAPLAEIGDRAKALRLYMQPDAIHPNADGVALIVEGIGPSVAELVEIATEE